MQNGIGALFAADCCAGILSTFRPSIAITPTQISQLFSKTSMKTSDPQTLLQGTWAWLNVKKVDDTKWLTSTAHKLKELEAEKVGNAASSDQKLYVTIPYKLGQIAPLDA